MDTRGAGRGARGGETAAVKDGFQCDVGDGRTFEAGNGPER